MSTRRATDHHCKSEHTGIGLGARLRQLSVVVGIGLAVLLPARSYAAKSCPKGTHKQAHVVVSGDTLGGIANRYDVTVSALKKYNPKLNDRFIFPGQELRVCTKQRPSEKKKKSTASVSCRQKHKHTHTVSSGESLSKIAERYGVKEKDIVARNSSLRKNKDSLKVGQKLSVCTDPKRITGAAACGYRTPVHNHKVIPGEWVSSIAGRYGVRRRDLYRLNPKLKANPHLIRPGQKVRVCPEIAPRNRVKLTHTVKQGDNLASVAKKHGLTVRELDSFQEGKLKNRNNLRIGQELVIWKDGRLVPGFGSYDDNTGVLKTGTQLPSGKDYYIKRPSVAWGTTKSIRLIQQAARSYRRKSKGGPKVHVGDVSKKGGGKFPPHKSHQHGRDVDIGYPLKAKPKLGNRFHYAKASTMDVERVWLLLKAFLDTDEIQYIFMDYSLQRKVYDYLKDKKKVSSDTLDELFQYPRGRHRAHGIIRHSRGHVNHFHVRFRR